MGFALVNGGSERTKRIVATRREPRAAFCACDGLIAVRHGSGGESRFLAFIVSGDLSTFRSRESDVREAAGASVHSARLAPLADD